MKIFDLLLISFSIEFPKNKAKVFQVMVAVNYFEHLIVRVITVFFFVMPGNNNKHQAISSYRPFKNYLSNFKQNCGSERKFKSLHITATFQEKLQENSFSN